MVRVWNPHTRTGLQGLRGARFLPIFYRYRSIMVFRTQEVVFGKRLLFPGKIEFLRILNEFMSTCFPIYE